MDELGSAPGPSFVLPQATRIRPGHGAHRLGKIDHSGRHHRRDQPTRADHIVTIEDPIEFLHQHKRCVVNQREVGTDTKAFPAALRSALRQDPDIILIGEMRDLETIQIALTAAETGHLVFATLHTQDCPQTIDRMIDVFPPHQQEQIRVQIAATLEGIVTQQLLPKASGQGKDGSLRGAYLDSGGAQPDP